MPTLQQNLLRYHHRLLVSAILVVFWSFMTAVSSSPLSSSSSSSSAAAAAALTPRRHRHYEIGVDGALREIVIDNVPVVISAVEDNADGIISSSSSSASTTATTIIVDKNKNYGLRGNNDNDDGTIYYELEGTINRQKKVWDFITTFDEYKTSNLYQRENGGGRPVLTNVKYMIVPIYWKEEVDGNTVNPYTMDLTQLAPIMEQNQHFYDEMSWNQMNFDYEMIQQGQLSNFAISWENPSFDDTSDRTRAMLDEELGYVQGEDYDSIELIYSVAKDGPFSGAGGWGAVNGDFLWMSYPISLSVTRHEGGHNFGHPHHKTNSYEYRQTRPEMVESLENGAGRWDGFDLMSGGNNVGNPGHFAAASKWFFGWIPDTSVVNIQPEGSTTECPNCVKEGTFRFFSFDDKATPPTPSRKMAAHIPIAVDGTTLYSFWLSYQGSETYNGATSKGLSVHFSYFTLRKDTLYGCEYDSHRMYAITNDEDSGSGIDKTASAFVAVDTCYVIPSSPYMKDRDPTAMEEIANPVVCVTNINEGTSIDVSVSFDDTNSNSNTNDEGGGAASDNIDNNNVSKTTLDCSSSSTSIVEMEYEFNSNDDTSNLIHVINTGADADITLSLCTTSTDDSLSNVVTSAFLYDEYPLSFIGYDSNPAYGSFKSVEVTSDQCSPTVSYQSDYDNTYILIPSSSIESVVSVSCKQNSCANNSYRSSETGKCKACPPNHLSSSTISNDISDCVECSAGTYLSHPYSRKCTTDLRFQKITSSMQWRIMTTPQHIPEVDWAWDVQELEFYDNIGCTGTKIPTNTGTPIDSGNAGPGYTANNALGGGAWIWGGRPNQHGVFYIGMAFQIAVTVKCIRVENSDGKAASEIRIQAFNTDTNKWENAWIARNLDASGFASNTISMDYPADDRPPTSAPRPPPTPFPTLFPTPTPTLEPSKHPSNAPNDYDTASTGWRIYTTPQDIPEVDWAWDVQELEFYANLDCTTKISTNTGMPIDSGNAGPGWTANNAFDEWAWGGRQDQNGVFWIGMSFQEVVTVKCIRIQNTHWIDKTANEIQIQAFNTNVNEWETVWIARDLDTSGSAWNTISLDFPSGDNPDDEVTTQTMVPSSTIIKRYKSEEGGDGIWYQLTSKPATASAIDYSTDYYNQLCQEEFGSGSWIVDWSNDLKFLHKRNEIENLLTALGIDDPTFNESCFFVTENGADFYGDNRKYFFENHGGNPPNNWLVHDQLGDISLGSWYGIEGKVLCKYCDENAAPCYN